ncbi:GH22928 [Drosophila grimshawi]|uniref:trypsin n=2 Tax=Drosophila grimshawi TaxID=7222 RepID=B4JVW1_DROGR|nr:GH22928 [Drosophila grimshawi]
MAMPTNQEFGRIVGGTDLAIHNAPWQVSIQLSARHICGGSIYSKDIILTAAHCVKDKSVTLLQVRVGSNRHNAGGTLIPVATYKLHEHFDPYLLHYDIALLRLATQISFSLSVKPIALAATSPSGGSSVFVSGWGNTEEENTAIGTGKYSSSLQLVQLQIIERDDCSSAKYGYGWDFVGQEMICAATDNKDACTGDSGGPLVSASLLAGIVSWGHGCAQPNYPGVYVNVAVMRSWIIKTANEV